MVTEGIRERTRTDCHWTGSEFNMYFFQQYLLAWTQKYYKTWICPLSMGRKCSKENSLFLVHVVAKEAWIDQRHCGKFMVFVCFCSSLFPPGNPMVTVSMLPAVDGQVPKTPRKEIFHSGQRNWSFKKRNPAVVLSLSSLSSLCFVFPLFFLTT